MTASDIMTVREVAAYLQLGYRSVYRLAQRGELPGRKVLGRWRFHVRHIDAWLRDGPSIAPTSEQAVDALGDNQHRRNTPCTGS